MDVRAFPLWPEGKFWPDQTYADFFLRDLPFRSEWRDPAGRFNHWRKFHLRWSPDGTLVLFYRVKLQAVLAFARLLGGHHDADDPSLSFADGKPPTGYFVVDPASVVLLGKPIHQDELPWTTARAGASSAPRHVELRLRQAWYLDSSPALEATFLEVANAHQPMRPDFEHPGGYTPPNFRRMRV
jgi:hypothetical protein